MRPLHELGAAEAVALLRQRTITAEALVQALLDRIATEEPRVRAFEHLDPALALAAARRVDAASPRPPLAGLPVAVKDIVDTADLRTERGSPIHRGRRPSADATCVARLRAAGAVILGKTVTTEFAFYRPGKTRNPHDPARTPGGSSSGSAAAVAAGMVPAAIGSQTAGSIVRPASFCGVVGWKPSRGLLPLDRVSPLAPSLDTLGLLVRAVEDVPLLMDALGAPLSAAGRAGPPRVGLCRTEQWPLAEPASRAAVEDAARALAAAGAPVEEVALGPAFDGLAGAQRTIMAAETARTFREAHDRHGDLLSPVLLEFVREGERVAPEQEAAARAQAVRCGALLGDVFERVDVLLTPAAVGEAPVGLSSTGDPAFNRSWTLLGAPCLALPSARGPAGLPVGIQLVGAVGADGALVEAGAWIARALGISR